ncbi:MAG: HAD family hydrolase [Komarekiella atlantica HA4396-MV6]|jgi:FMN phosphatase YigB (HAD superfamily)|nr:HAD family hydrolase [Komarekiella atlantica HA4396-MV6]
MSLLERFKVVLLDMNGTFMFGGDRFSESEDYAKTYHAIGGQKLTDSTVNNAIQACYNTMAVYYEDLERYNSFPQIVDTLRTFPQIAGIEEQDILYLAQVIALHELGKVPPEYAVFLKKLATTHKLGLVANIWAKKQLWLKELDQVGVGELFETMIFSSDSSSIKPSPKLFEEALRAFKVDKSQVVFIGDSIKFDIQGAKAVGLATIWIKGKQEDNNEADIVINDLLDLQSGSINK